MTCTTLAVLAWMPFATYLGGAPIPDRLVSAASTRLRGVDSPPRPIRVPAAASPPPRPIRGPAAASPRRIESIRAADGPVREAHVARHADEQRGDGQREPLPVPHARGRRPASERGVVRLADEADDRQFDQHVDLRGVGPTRAKTFAEMFRTTRTLRATQLEGIAQVFVTARSRRRNGRNSTLRGTPRGTGSGGGPACGRARRIPRSTCEDVLATGNARGLTPRASALLRPPGGGTNSCPCGSPP